MASLGMRGILHVRPAELVHGCAQRPSCYLWHSNADRGARAVQSDRTGPGVSHVACDSPFAVHLQWLPR